MMTLSSRDEMALVFGAAALLLSIIFGLMSGRRSVFVVVIVVIIGGAILISLSSIMLFLSMNTKAQAVARAADESNSQLEDILPEKISDPTSDTAAREVAFEFVKSIQALDVEKAHGLILESAFPTFFPELTEQNEANLEDGFRRITELYSDSPGRMLQFLQLVS